MKKTLLATLTILAVSPSWAKTTTVTCTTPDDSIRIVVVGSYDTGKFVGSASMTSPYGSPQLKSVENSMFRTLEGTVGDVDNHHDYQLTLLDEGFGLTTTAFLLDSEYVDRIGNQPPVETELSCN